MTIAPQASLARMKHFNLNVATPKNGLNTNVGADIKVTGTVGSDEVKPLVSVEIQVDNQSSIDANCTPNTPPNGEVHFDATVQVDHIGTGQHVMVVTASDNHDRQAVKTVKIYTIHIPPKCSWGVPWENAPATQSLEPFAVCGPQTTQDVVDIVKSAEAQGKRVHAFGSKWSFSDCATTGDIMVDTRFLSGPVPSAQSVQNALKPGLGPVHHIRAGTVIEDLYMFLEGLGLALETMGGSSGQTLAGAISTGTHGGDKRMPPLADSVLAVHIVGSGGTEYWIEPSIGITDPAKVQGILPGVSPNNIIYDNDTFDAVLVSLGCMGIIVDVVLRVRQQYNLLETTEPTTWQDFQASYSTWLSDPDNRFLQIIVDPYKSVSGKDSPKGTNYALVTTRKEVADLQGAAAPTGNDFDGAKKFLTDLVIDNLDIWDKIKALFDGVANDDLVTAVNYVLQNLDASVRNLIVDNYPALMQFMFPPLRNVGGLSYVVMDGGRRAPKSNHCADNVGPYEGDSVEMCFDAKGNWMEFVSKALETIQNATNSLLVGYFAIRFTGQSRAMLGMQQWPQTVSIEISALGKGTERIIGERDFMTSILDLMYQYGGLPHWGQLVDLNVQGHGSLYRRFRDWRKTYAWFSNNFTTRTFENELSKRWQLTVPDSELVHLTRVPDLSRLTLTEARKVVKKAGLGLGPVGNNNERVDSQDPHPGTPVARGGIVFVIPAPRQTRFQRRSRKSRARVHKRTVVTC